MDFSKLIDASVLAGWVRAGVASGLVWAVHKWSPLASVLDADTQLAIAAAASGIVVGLWSQLAKKAST